MQDKPVQVGSEFHWPFIAAWVCCVIFYFLQYALRSAPGVMIPELTSSFGLSALGVSSLIGLYYYTYSTFAILSGACFDRYGAKYVEPMATPMHHHHHHHHHHAMKKPMTDKKM
jgi:sugar phosphate permease